MASAVWTQKGVMGSPLATKPRQSRTIVDKEVCMYAGKGSKVKKTDLKTQGLEKVSVDAVRNNLKGVSRYMSNKGWIDPQGRKGKGLGVYRFSGKYGSNVDGYSPIFTPDIWSEAGETYQFGTKGILAWMGLLVIGALVAGNLIISTSNLSP